MYIKLSSISVKLMITAIMSKPLNTPIREHLDEVCLKYLKYTRFRPEYCKGQYRVSYAYLCNTKSVVVS